MRGLTESVDAVRAALGSAEDLVVLTELDLTRRGLDRRWRFEVGDRCGSSRLVVVVVSRAGVRVLAGARPADRVSAVPLRSLVEVVRGGLALDELEGHPSRYSARSAEYERARALGGDPVLAALVRRLEDPPDADSVRGVNRYAASCAVDAFLLVEESAERVGVGLGVLTDLASGVPVEWALRRAPSTRASS